VSRGRRPLLVALAAAAAALALPASAFAHAALLRTSPSASVTLSKAPTQITLTYSEPVEPKFAIVSVTNAGGQPVTSGRPTRSPTNADQLIQPVRHVPEGWYLVFWRVVSVDGHPVRGAFTFAVGPNPGPAPQFVIPSISETAATPALLVLRWIVFLTMMSAIGLFVLRAITARPLVRTLKGSSLRAIALAFWASLALALISIPIYVYVATAKFSLRSIDDFSGTFPLLRSSAFGRGFLDLELALALFAVAAAVSLWLDRPDRPVRSVAELLALTGAIGAAAACLLVPGLAGHAAQTSPRGLSVAADWIHLASGSIWVGGLCGLLVLYARTSELLRVAALSFVVPRFSNTAFASVNLLIASGIAASLVHIPTLASMWQTSYGKTLSVKVMLLLAAGLLASVNLARTKPRLQAASTHPERARGAAVLLRGLVGGEVVFVFGAVFAAALLSSLAPPSKALARIGKAEARVGPGAFSQHVRKEGYDLDFRVTPNRAALPNSFVVRITKDGKPVQNASVVTHFAMLDMDMQELAYSFPERQPGVYVRSAPALVMVGHWGLQYQITIPGKPPIDVLLVDRASG
jgi:copper transport protein